ncbi:MAG: B12-binding domain-containing radical SAM protein, partial [Thermodesulfobacteriota bacterium]
MKILLIQPVRKKQTIGFDRMIFCEPLGLEMVAGALKGHNVCLLDMRLRDSLPKVLSSFRPDVCGISCSYTIDVSSSLHLAKVIKANGHGPFVVIGGHHATMMPKDFFHDEIDAIVVGEGEATMRELVEGLERRRDLREIPGLFINTKEGFVPTGHRDFFKDLDELPFPDYRSIQRYRRYYHMGFQKPLALVETARGCPYHCNFCSVW